MSKFGKVLGVLVVLGAAGGGYYYWQKSRAAEPVRAARPVPPTPVVVGIAGEQDIPVFQTAIGTVQAYNNVTVRARVDGQLEKVSFTEGQDVKAGDVLAVIDPRPFQTALEQAEAMKARDEAQLANAQRDLQRTLDLRDFASKQTQDNQRTTVTQLLATLQADKAAIDNAKVQLSYTTIMAPISGRTGARLVDQGNMVRATEGAALLSITQVEPIFITFTLPQDLLDDVARAQARGPVTVEALKRDDVTKLASGNLSLIDNQIDQATGTIRLKATFANADRRLWPGQFVNVHVLTETRNKAVTVAARVIQRGPQGTYVYVVKPDKTAELRPVKVGPTRNQVAVIDSGLASGETVIVEGQYKVRPGGKVEPSVATSSDAKTASNS